MQHGAHEAPPTPEQQAVAASRRRVLWLSSKPSAWSYALPVVGIVAGLLFTATSQVADGTNLRSTVTNLPDLIRDESQRVAVKQQQVGNYRDEIAALSSDESSGAAAVRRANAQAAKVAAVAGAEAVRGETLTVVLDDSSLRADNLPAGVTVDDIVVHQQDVQAFVNAMWAGGAEAMMIMDQRVISTSAVRCVGNTLILQDRVYSPPFTITAIGDPSAMRAAIDANEQANIYKEYVSAVGLGLAVTDGGVKEFPPTKVRSNSRRPHRPPAPPVRRRAARTRILGGCPRFSSSTITTASSTPSSAICSSSARPRPCAATTRSRSPRRPASTVCSSHPARATRNMPESRWP